METSEYLAYVKKYGTDNSLYYASQHYGSLTISELPYRIKAVLRYPFRQRSTAGFLPQVDPYDYRVSTNLPRWLQQTALGHFVGMVLKPYLLMIHTPKTAQSTVVSKIKEVFEALLHACTHLSTEELCAVVAVLKHMRRAGTLDYILPHIKSSTLFGVKFLHAWLTGSLQMYLEEIGRWGMEYSRWMLAILGGITAKTCSCILTCLPWTHRLFLLQPLPCFSKYLFSCALDSLPCCMRHCTQSVPSLLSICLVQTVKQFPDLFGNCDAITLHSFSDVESGVPHDLAETIPLLLLLNQHPEALSGLQEKVLGDVFTTCFDWFAQRQELSTTGYISHAQMVCWHKVGLPFSDRQLLIFAEKSDEVIEFLASVHETLPAHQVLLLKQAEFQRQVRSAHIENVQAAKRLRITGAQFAEWSQTEPTQLQKLYDKTQSTEPDYFV